MSDQKSFNDVEENLQELSERINNTLNFEVMIREVESDGYLSDDLRLVDLHEFRKVENKLLREGLLETATHNLMRFLDAFEEIYPQIKNDVDKILLSIDTLKLLGEKKALKKVSPEKTKAPVEVPKEEISGETSKEELVEPIKESTEEIDPEEKAFEEFEEKTLDKKS